MSSGKSRVRLYRNRYDQAQHSTKREARKQQNHDRRKDRYRRTKGHAGRASSRFPSLFWRPPTEIGDKRIRTTQLLRGRWGAAAMRCASRASTRRKALPDNFVASQIHSKLLMLGLEVAIGAHRG